MQELKDQDLNPVAPTRRAPPLPLVPLNYDGEEELTLEQRKAMFGQYEESMQSIGEGEIVRGTSTQSLVISTSPPPHEAASWAAYSSRGPPGA